MVDYRIDYLQFSSTENFGWEFGEDGMLAHGSPMPFYKISYLFANKASVHLGNVKSDKPLYVLTGKACENIGITPYWLSRRLENGAKVSRIDFAITASFSFLQSMLFDVDKIDSKMFSDVRSLLDKNHQAQTIYCGDMKKRGKHGIIRAYDKAIELGLEGVKLERLEYESRGKQAPIDARRYANGETVQSIIQARFIVRANWFNKLMSGEKDIAVSRFYDNVDNEAVIGRKMRWLETQVLPTLRWVKAYDKLNNTDNLTRFLEKVENYKHD